MSILLAVSKRHRRVGLALFAIAVLSVADLYLTRHAMTTVGMFESNPVARTLVRAAGTAWPLVVLKAGSVAAAAGIFFTLRRRWQGEVGAWLAAALLLGVMVNWGLYLSQFDGVDEELLRNHHANDPSWVRIQAPS